jgi:hypothetical protein
VTGPTAEQPQVTATVSPPTPQRTRWGAIPRHLGRARTSTVVLSLLFLAIGALWLNIRPLPETVAPARDGAVVDEPATTDTAVPTTPAPTPTTEPVPTPSDVPTTAPEVPATSTSTSTSETTAPTGTGTRFPTTTSEPPAPLPDATSTPTG